MIRFISLIALLGALIGIPQPPPFTFRLPFVTLERRWEPVSDNCLNFGRCSGSQTGGLIGVAWSGMHGLIYMRVRLIGLGPVGHCPLGPSYRNIFPLPLAARGVFTMTHVLTGFYAVVIETTGPRGQTYSNELPVKENCEF